MHSCLRHCFCALSFLSFCWHTTSAQQTDYESIILPVDVKARDFAEYLVQLAWLNNPEGIIAIEEMKNAQDNARNTSKEWMRDVNASFNLNEVNLRTPDTLGNTFYPRYNFGLNLNLYNLLSQKGKNKIGKREVEIAEWRVKQAKLALRQETLARYAKFKLAREILKTRTLVEQEANANFILIQQLYKTDDKTFEEYSTASGVYFEAQEARIKAETDVQLAKLQLEEIVGLKWEQIQHPAKD